MLLLGWTTGRAHDVADHLVAQFDGVAALVNTGGNAECLEIRRSETARLTVDGLVATTAGPQWFNTVILARGFGVEENPFDLPWNNYWRVDPLDQTFLDEDQRVGRIVVVGAGDGALIEVLRSRVQSLDQGALLDSILNGTLEDNDVRGAVRDIESHGPDGSKFYRYCELGSPAIEEVLRRDLRRSYVTWLMLDEEPFKRFSLPINRFIISRLVRLSREAGEKGFLTGPVCGAQTKVVLGYGRGYVVKYRHAGVTKFLECEHAIIRYGPQRERAEVQRGSKLLDSIAKAIVDGPEKQRILQGIRDHFSYLREINGHATCHLPRWDNHWADSDRFKAVDPRRAESAGTPSLRADFVKVFPKDAAKDRKRPVYRIRIRMPQMPKHLHITYDLHPETGRPISRVAYGATHEQWLNTNANYRIRGRANDGREWDLGTVVDALQRGGREPWVERDGGGCEAYDDAIQVLLENPAKLD